MLCHDPLLLLRRIHKYSLRAPLVFPKYKEVIIPTRRPAFHKQFFSLLLVFSTPNWWMIQVTYIHSKYLKLSLHEMFLFHLRRHIWAQSQSGQFPRYRIWDTPGTSSVSLTVSRSQPGLPDNTFLHQNPWTTSHSSIYSTSLCHLQQHFDKSNSGRSPATRSVTQPLS